jgi:predicted MFS family arabinose efflux permease
MRLALSDQTKVISALGIVQIFAWGSTYYLLAVLIEPILKDTGWPRMSVTAGISVGLLASGLVAMRVGRLIQTYGGRPVLTAATGLMATGLGLLAAAPNIACFLLAWVVIGVGMGAGLYDAAFSTLGRLYGTDARRAITTLTLWGGFASTICWPISAWLVQTVGWRGTCLAYAGLHLFILVPICLTLMPRQVVLAPARVTKGDPQHVQPLRDPRFWLLAAAGMVLSFVSTVWSVLLLSILHTRGVGAAEAVALGVLIGPAQVGARVFEMALGGRYHPIWTMVAATCLVGLGFLGLLLHLPASVALVAYGAGNGIWSIARGAVPLSLFGAENYPRMMGRLATPNLLVAAAAPFLGAMVLDAYGGEVTLLLLTLVSLVPIACALVLLRLRTRPPAQACRQTFTAE